MGVCHLVLWGTSSRSSHWVLPLPGFVMLKCITMMEPEGHLLQVLRQERAQYGPSGSALSYGRSDLYFKRRLQRRRNGGSAKSQHMSCDIETLRPQALEQSVILRYTEQCVMTEVIMNLSPSPVPCSPLPRLALPTNMPWVSRPSLLCHCIQGHARLVVESNHKHIIYTHTTYVCL